MIEAVERLRGLFGKCFIECKEHNVQIVADKEVFELADEIEREVAERYMELPVDADGVPIHVGDLMCSVGIREKGHKVIASAVYEDGFVEYGNGNGLIGPLRSEDWVHAKPDKLRELMNEFGLMASMQGHQYGLVAKEMLDAVCADIREMAKEGEL